MYLEGLTVSVNYADYLAISLPVNVGHFDKFVVVTAREDTETQRVCGEHGVQFILTDRLQKNGATFNKGCALNDGLAALSCKHWVATIDADTVLPITFRETLEGSAVDPRLLFSAKRRVCETRELWDKHGCCGHYSKLPYTMKDLRGFRHFGPGGTGYLAVFHSDAPALEHRQPWFTEFFPDATIVDVEFARSWGDDRVWLPLDAIHLGPVELNWKGRVSDRFDT